MRRIRSPSGNSSTSSRSKAGNISNSRSKNSNHRNSSCSRKSKEISKWKDNDEIIFHVTNDIKSCRCTSSSLGVTAKAGASNSLTGKKIEKMFMKLSEKKEKHFIGERPLSSI